MEDLGVSLEMLVNTQVKAKIIRVWQHEMKFLPSARVSL